ncbi:3D (Asp-Asp-Asp) domain-containing protein [Salsuginibacillus halophilus]|uniref:3D (Asp-Asp-Asp) domain-containing protein n=1 Tax=Salsuginibacillus halophilus TaxID=517424 RepID=A0A2P8HBG1_9BACI|nr:peptidoglycan-binding protein [Salsuginibacillus halophilus]PSL43565.1 3D (Asp-Asp-Asp) domain-containing protein [Salsuginibacillus halophilus]
MNVLTPVRHVKAFGFSALAAGFVFALSPSSADASELGNDLLKEGTENGEVKEFQELLYDNDIIADQEDIDGVYDTEIAQLVKSYQDEHNLLTDGIAGPQTIGALQVLELEDEGPTVEFVQEDLQTAGYYNGSIDGIFGENTLSAVEQFQSSAGLTTDGKVGPKTLSALQSYEPAVTAASEEAAAEQPAEQETNNEPAASEQQQTQQQETQQQENQQQNQQQETQSSEANGQTMTMEATAYTANCTGCTGITATGQDLNNNPNKSVVAVDPNVIPLGSRVHVEGYGEAIAGDTGGAIQGNRIDLHVPTKDEAYSFGRQNVQVTVLD